MNPLVVLDAAKYAKKNDMDIAILYGTAKVAIEPTNIKDIELKHDILTVKFANGGLFLIDCNEILTFTTGKNENRVKLEEEMA